MEVKEKMENKDTELLADTLSDLPVVDELADGTKGGGLRRSPNDPVEFIVVGSGAG